MYIKYTEMGVILPHTVADSKGALGASNVPGFSERHQQITTREIT
jgi:hypothetical protein